MNLETEPKVTFTQEQVDEIYRWQIKLMIADFKEKEARIAHLDQEKKRQSIWMAHVRTITISNFIQIAIFAILVVFVWFKG
jgi:hypothetical protein